MARTEAVAQIAALIPPNDYTAFSDFEPVSAAIEEARQQRETKVKPDWTAAVYVDFDTDIHEQVLEITGRSLQIAIPCRVSLPLLVLHIKDIGKFLDVEVTFVEGTGQLRHLLFTNRMTAIRTSTTSATLPLQLVPGWNHLPIHLPTVAAAAFGGETYVECTGVVLHSTMRIAHVFFEDKEYHDAQLPVFLRTIKTPM